jgi:hypothetical protein
MATVVDVNTVSWTLIGTGLKTVIIQISGTAGEVFVGGSAPADTDDGYSLPSGLPVSVPSIASLGGGVWAKGTGHARYDSV